MKRNFILLVACIFMSYSNVYSGKHDTNNPDHNPPGYKWQDGKFRNRKQLQWQIDGYIDRGTRCTGTHLAITTVCGFASFMSCLYLNEIRKEDTFADTFFFPLTITFITVLLAACLCEPKRKRRI